MQTWARRVAPRKALDAVRERHVRDTFQRGHRRRRVCARVCASFRNRSEPLSREGNRAEPFGFRSGLRAGNIAKHAEDVEFLDVTSFYHDAVPHEAADDVLRGGTHAMVVSLRGSHVLAKIVFLVLGTLARRR